MIKDTASRKPAVPREGNNGSSPCASVSPVVKDIPFPREVLIDAARQFTRGVSWELIAENTGTSAGDLVTFSIDHPEVWGPLSERAEKLRLQEAEGNTLAGLTLLLKSDDETAAENAARELLIHRRHVERRRYQPPRHKDTKNVEGLNASEAAREATALSRDPGSNLVPWCLGGENEAPEELVRRITYAAHRVAHGGDYITIAGEVGHPREEVTRWAFIYAKAWDKAYPTSRRTAAQFGASLAINRLLDFVVGFDPKLAARAARTLLVHRRHMHWRLPERHLRCPTGGASLARTTPGGRNLTICQGGQKTSFENGTQNGERPAAEGACLPGSAGTTLTYPPSVAQVVVAIPGDGSLKVARRSGPARSSGAVRPSADSRPRDGP